MQSCASQKSDSACLVGCIVTSFILSSMFISQCLAGRKSAYIHTYLSSFVYVLILFRLLQAEESVKTLESIRFDLSTRNAELQEKVVKVQEQMRELRNRPREEQDITRVENLTRQLDSANKQIVKLKAQHKTKVKNLTKQLDGLKQVRNVLCRSNFRIC